MRLIIKPEDDEKFEKIDVSGVSDYFFAIRGKNKLGIPYAPIHGYKGEYAFILGWLEYLKEIVKDKIHETK